MCNLDRRDRRRRSRRFWSAPRTAIKCTHSGRRPASRRTLPGFRVLAPSDAAAGRRPRSGWCEVEHDDVPPLCARLLAELSRRNEPTALADLPEHLRQKAVLSGCERRGLAVGVVWYEGAPGSIGVLPGGAPYVAVGTSAGWYPSAGLTHRPAPTHFAITPKGKAWLEEAQLRADPHVEKLRAAAEAVGEYERRYQEGLERVSRAVQSVPPFAETMKEAYLEALAEHGQRTAADPPKALPAPTGDAKPQEQPPLRSDSEPVDPIPLTWLREQVPASKVKGDASKLAAWLTRRNVRVYKVAGRNYAERADLLRVFKAGSRVHELIAEYNGDGE